jgi:malate synthase
MSRPDGVEILGPAEPRFDEILTDEAIAFVAGLQREFGGRRAELLEARGERVRSAGRRGRSQPRRPTCGTAASRSPAPPTARW